MRVLSLRSHVNEAHFRSGMKCSLRAASALIVFFLVLERLGAESEDVAVGGKTQLPRLCVLAKQRESSRI